MVKLKLREAMKNAKNYFFGAVLWIWSSIDDAIQHCNVIYSWRIVNHHGELQPSMKEDMIMSGALSTQVPNCMLPLPISVKESFSRANHGWVEKLFLSSSVRRHFSVGCPSLRCKNPHIIHSWQEDAFMWFHIRYGSRKCKGWRHVALVGRRWVQKVQSAVPLITLKQVWFVPVLGF